MPTNKKHENVMKAAMDKIWECPLKVFLPEDRTEKWSSAVKSIARVAGLKGTKHILPSFSNDFLLQLLRDDSPDRSDGAFFTVGSVNVLIEVERVNNESQSEVKVQCLVHTGNLVAMFKTDHETGMEIYNALRDSCLDEAEQQFTTEDAEHMKASK